VYYQVHYSIQLVRYSYSYSYSKYYNYIAGYSQSIILMLCTILYIIVVVVVYQPPSFKGDGGPPGKEGPEEANWDLG
jgi:hypothetical protein